MLRMRFTSSAVAGLLPSANAAISLRISAIAGPVLSICTGALAIHGRWPTELTALLACTVRPVLVFTQVHVQARGEVTADDAVGDVEAGRAGSARRRHHLAGEQVGLHRTRLVDQEHARALRQRYVGGRLHLRGVATGLPVAQLLVQQRHDLGQGGVTDHDQGAVLRAQPVVVEVDQVFAGQAIDRRFVTAAGERNGIRVALAVQQRRQHAHRHRTRVDLLLLDAGDPARLDPVDLALLEARLTQQVAVQRQRRCQIFLQRRQVHAHRIQAGRGIQAGTQCVGGIGEGQ
ncbi:Uncharacterised protein [Stenotrophomonas maltophilia]|nr:Uncharacterised protein [Stenotrophomonas maltophilia]